MQSTTSEHHCPTSTKKLYLVKKPWTLQEQIDDLQSE